MRSLPVLFNKPSHNSLTLYRLVNCDQRGSFPNFSSRNDTLQAPSADKSKNIQGI